VFGFYPFNPLILLLLDRKIRMIEVRKLGADRRKFKGVIFDLDGVLVKSSLDFKLIRRKIFNFGFNGPVLRG